MRTVLITGASGFFGKSLIDALKKTKNDHEFICVYHTKRYDIEDTRFSWIQADLLNHTTHHSLMHTLNPTDFIHLAWDVPPGNFWHSLKNVDWLYASVSLFNEFGKVGGKKFIGAGSSTEYDWTASILDEENTPLNPSTLYGECKKSLHAIIEKIQQRDYKEIALIWARIGYFFGLQEPPQKLITRIIHAIITQTPLNLVEKEISRPYAHVKYVGEALAQAILYEKGNMVFNLSGTTSYPLKDIVDFIGKQLRKPTSTISYGTYKSPIEEPRDLKFNTHHLEKLMGSSIPDTFYNDLEDMLRKVKHAEYNRSTTA